MPPLPGATGAWLAARGRLVATDLEPVALSLYRERHPDVTEVVVAETCTARCVYRGQ